jgi:Ion channel
MARDLRAPYFLFRTLAARKFLLLFLFLLGSLVLYPFAESNVVGYYAFRVFGSVVILFCIYAVSFRRWVVVAAAALAIPAFANRVLNLSVDASALSILNIVLSFLFDAFVVVIIFRRVFAAGQPTAETIFGALSIYLLVGFAFASIFGMISILNRQAFYLDPAVNHHAHPDRFDFVYYSYATMSSVGAVGITPVSGEARSMTVIEAIIGILYLVVLISRLVAAYRHPVA